MIIIYLPIEPLEERYSKDWYNWTTFYLKELESTFDNFSWICYCPPTYKEIEQGSFLDCIHTNDFKAKQLQEVISWIEDNKHKDLSDTVIYLQDGWYPGIEMLAYIRDAMDMKFKIAACFHAGTWDEKDFISQRGMGRWAKGLERSWLSLYDIIFVATEFHKELIMRSGSIPIPYDWNKIQVTGFPIHRPNVPIKSIGYRSGIVFPHRLDPEKRPDYFDRLRTEIEGLGPFIKTKDVCNFKKDYYEELARAKYAVSFAEQETWGIAMQEAVMLGCIPIVPNRLSYEEMYPDIFQYEWGTDPVGNAAKRIMQIDRMTESEETRKVLYGKVANLSNSFVIAGMVALPIQMDLMAQMVNGE